MSASCVAASACHAVAPAARLASHRASRVSRPALTNAKKKNASTPRAGARAAASAGGSASHAPGLRAVWSIDAKYGHKANAVEMLREWVHTVGVAAGLDPTHVSLLTGAIGSPESSVEMEIAGFGNMAEIDAFFNAIPGAEHRKWGERFAAHVVDGSPIWRIVRVVPVHAPPSTVSQSRASTSASVTAKDGAELVFADEDEDSMSAEDPMAAAIRKALEGGFEMPAKVAPRAPRRPSGIQFDGVDVFEADAFGDASAPGGLVFPSSNDDENENGNEDEDEDGEDAASSSAGGSDETDDGGIDLSQYPPGSKVVTDWKGDPMVITPGDKLPFAS